MSPSSKLAGSARSLEDRKPVWVEPAIPNQLPPTAVQQSSGGTNRRSLVLSKVIVSDVSGQANPSFLLRSSRIENPNHTVPTANYEASVCSAGTQPGRKTGRDADCQ